MEQQRPSFLPPRRLGQLSRATKQVVAGLLAVVAIGNLCLLAIVWFHLTPPGSALPDWRQADRLLAGAASPSLVERLLEAEAERIEGGSSMRPAFTTESVGWQETTQGLTDEAKAALLQEREGERQALLAWVRAGGGREAYEKDDFSWPELTTARPLTANYRIGDSQGLAGVKIRSLIADRCVTCHSEHGRHDTARFIPLDRYEHLAPRLAPDNADSVPAWFLATILTLPLMTLMAGLVFWRSSQPRIVRVSLFGFSFVSSLLMVGCWWTGFFADWNGLAILCGITVATVAISIQALVALSEFVRPSALVSH